MKIILCYYLILMCVSCAPSIYFSEHKYHPFENGSVFQTPIKFEFIDILGKMHEPVVLHASPETETIRYITYSSVIGASQLVQISKFPCGEIQIYSKSLSRNLVGEDRVDAMHLSIIRADQYEYLIMLIGESNFWNLPVYKNVFTHDSPMTVLEVHHRGQYHRIYDVNDRNSSLIMLSGYLSELAKFMVELQPQLWPLIAYYDVYDHISLDVGGACLARRQHEFQLWSTTAEIREVFGDPHEVRTYPEGIRWGYYLKDRGLMVLLFDHEGFLQSHVPWIHYSEEPSPEFNYNLFKSANRRPFEKSGPAFENGSSDTNPEAKPDAVDGTEGDKTTE